MVQSLCTMVLLEGCSPRQAFTQFLLARKVHTFTLACTQDKDNFLVNFHYQDFSRRGQGGVSPPLQTYYSILVSFCGSLHGIIHRPLFSPHSNLTRASIAASRIRFPIS